MTDTRRSYDAQRLVDAIDRYLEARFVAPSYSMNNRYVKAARAELVSAIVQATGNPEPE